MSYIWNPRILEITGWICSPQNQNQKTDLPTTLFWGGKDPGENGGKTGEQFVRQSAGMDTRYFDQARENTIKDASLDIVTRFCYENLAIMAGQPTNPLLT